MFQEDRVLALRRSHGLVDFFGKVRDNWCDHLEDGA
jgi:hypothetical protein